MAKKVRVCSKDQFSSRNLKVMIEIENKSQWKEIPVLGDLNNKIKKF